VPAREQPFDRIRLVREHMRRGRALGLGERLKLAGKSELYNGVRKDRKARRAELFTKGREYLAASFYLLRPYTGDIHFAIVHKYRHAG
jgi:hypothetical protein